MTNAPFHVPESRSGVRESRTKKPRKSAIFLIKRLIYEVSFFCRQRDLNPHALSSNRF